MENKQSIAEKIGKGLVVASLLTMPFYSTGCATTRNSNVIKPTSNVTYEILEYDKDNKPSKVEVKYTVKGEEYTRIIESKE